MRLREQSLVEQVLQHLHLDDLLQESPGTQDFVKSLSKMVKANEHPDWEVIQVLQSLRSQLSNAAACEEAEEAKKEDAAKEGNPIGEEPRF